MFFLLQFNELYVYVVLWFKEDILFCRSFVVMEVALKSQSESMNQAQWEHRMSIVEVTVGVILQ